MKGRTPAMLLAATVAALVVILVLLGLVWSSVGSPFTDDGPQPSKPTLMVELRAYGVEV